MKKEQQYYSAGKVCLLLDISMPTLNRWYEWYSSPRYHVPPDMYLPDYVFKNLKKTRYWKVEDLAHLRKFKKQVRTTHRGCMADYHKEAAWYKAPYVPRPQRRIPRKPGEYVAKGYRDLTDVSKERDRKEEKLWQQEQEKEVKRRKQEEKG